MKNIPMLIHLLLLGACALLMSGCSYSSEATDALACEAGQTREGQACVDGFWVDDADQCIGENCCNPVTCAQEGAECGQIDDGCGTTIDCGACPEGEACGNGGPNICGPGDCEPITCEAAMLECGEIDPGCGLLPEDCGECEAPETCGAVNPNLCDCVPRTCEAQNLNCGMIDDGCGTMISCGTCSEPQTCGGGADGDNVCGCTPTTTCRSEGVACGTFTDDCGNAVDCLDGCFDEVSVYDRHACALDQGGIGVKCWGINDAGQLGTGDRTDQQRPTPVAFSNVELTWVDVSVGLSHSCAVASDGTVWCWGANRDAQLGIDPDEASGPGIRSTEPFQVPGVAGATMVSASADHTCVLESDTTIKCWGDNGFDQLGVPGQGLVLAATEVTGVNTPITSIATSPTHSCAIGDGQAFCWGADNFGQLGNGPGQGDAQTPDSINDQATFVSVTTGLLHSCAVTNQDSVKCWGAIQYDSANNASGTQQAPAAKTIAANTTQIASNSTSTCSIHASGIQCFGRNDSGQLGDGTTNDAVDPVDVAMLSGGISVSSGVRFSCAVDPQNTAWCWGRNESGQLGDGSMTMSLTPVKVLP